MKTMRTLAALFICAGFLVGTTSCFVVTRKDNGKHKGWNKNTNNPHNPNTTNPGKGNSKNK
jgi:hypothetical protein